MLLLPREGNDYQTPSRLDALGITYVCVAVIWTCVLFGGLAVFLRHRNVDFLRMRNPLLVSSAIVLIHVYLVLVLLLYPLNASYSCNATYWIMTLYFPLGIAMWHLANIRLLNLSYLQEELITDTETKTLYRRARRPSISIQSLKSWIQRQNLVGRTSLAIAISFVVQLIASIIIFSLSPKFHGSYRSSSDEAGPITCRKGWEWSVTVIVQALWTWIFGPILLFKISKIHDVHRWRLQTTLAIIFSLPGLPLWLLAVYSPSFERVNLFWAPAMWYAPGLIMMEFTTVFFPLMELHNIKKMLRSSIRKYDTVESGSSLSRGDSVNSAPSIKANTRSTWSLDTVLGSDEFLRFAATKDFTAENVLFLRRVREWKERFRLLKLNDGSVAESNKTSLYTDAAAIFAETVSLRTAPYPVNIESKSYLALAQRFASVQTLSDDPLVAPFLMDEDDSPGTMGNLTSKPKSKSARSKKIPTDFDEHVFDVAESSVVTLVRTNTWPRYLANLEKLSNEHTTHSRAPFKLPSRFPFSFPSRS